MDLFPFRHYHVKYANVKPSLKVLKWYPKSILIKCAYPSLTTRYSSGPLLPPKITSLHVSSKGKGSVYPAVLASETCFYLLDVNGECDLFPKRRDALLDGVLQALLSLVLTKVM